MNPPLTRQYAPPGYPGRVVVNRVDFPAMRSFSILSSAAAPVLLIGGWTLAAALQPTGFDPLRETISELAAVGARHRAVMTAALIGTGIAHLVTALGLTEVSRTGRLLIALGGAATLLVAAFPLPANGGSAPHAVFAGLAFGALAVWPFVASGRAAGAARALRPRSTILAGLILLGLVAWFGVTLRAGGPAGLAERVAAAAQSIWPFAVALSLRTATRSRAAAEPADH
jgi:hypothetical membrane protein